MAQSGSDIPVFGPNPQGELSRRYEELRKTVDQAAIVFTTDEKGFLLEFNDKLCELSGYSRAELVGHNIRLLNSGTHPPAFFSNLWDTVKRGGLWRGEIHCRGKAGHSYWVDATVVPLEGNPRRFMTFQVEVSARKQMEQNERRLVEILEASPDFVSIRDLEGRILFSNWPVKILCGVMDLDLETYGQGPLVHDYHAPSSQELLKQHALPFALQEGLWRGEMLLKDHEGRELPVSELLVAHRGLDGQVNFLSSVARDISEQIAAQRKLQELVGDLQEMRRAIHESTILDQADHHGRILDVNPAFCRITGYTKEEVLGRTYACINSSFHPKAFFQDLWHTITMGQVWRGEIKNKAKDGRAFWVDTVIIPRISRTGIPESYQALRLDITERKEAQENYQRMAFYDALTGLPNRLLMRDRLDRILQSARRNRRKVALLFMDLDGFKLVNDSLGHHAGDVLLKSVAERLRNLVREGDLVARLGGDEFLLVLGDIRMDADVSPLASKLLEGLAHTYWIEGQEIRVTPSIGISLFPQDGLQATNLVELADQAMYRVKRSGKNGFGFWGDSTET